MTPHKCPCCDGFGIRTIHEHMITTAAAITTIPERKTECAACQGTGIIWENEVASFSGGDLEDTSCNES